MAEPFLAEIRLFAGSYAPRGWAFCNGQLLPVLQNISLFSLLGTVYGGNGSTTFGLPDLRGRVPVHPGQGAGLASRRLGDRGGKASVALTAAELPVHTHALHAVPEDGNSSKIAGNGIGQGNDVYGPPNHLLELRGDALGETGAGQAHDNMQPYLALQFIIAVAGRFPTRD